MTRLTRYVLFAVLATIANLAMQRLVLAINSEAIGFAIAVVMGTAVGLVLKYILDKRWIFEDHSTGVAQHSRKFFLYSLMGVVTTLIFWVTETAFWIVWGTDAMRELGAVLGLAVGYTVKYQLDRRYVFTDAVTAKAA